MVSCVLNPLLLSIGYGKHQSFQLQVPNEGQVSQWIGPPAALKKQKREVVMKPVYFTIISGLKHFPVVLEDIAAAAVAAKSLQSCPTWCDSGQKPTRLLCPQDSLGKNTGVGCHFLLHLRILSVIKFDNFAKIYLIFDHSWSILICSLSEIILSLSLISFLILISFHWFIFIVGPFLILFFCISDFIYVGFFILVHLFGGSDSVCDLTIFFYSCCISLEGYMGWCLSIKMLWLIFPIFLFKVALYCFSFYS